MFKNIPGSHNLTISLNNQIRNNDGSLPNLSINNNIVEIELYGIKRFVDINWLALISFYEIELPVQFQSRLFDVEFLDINTKIFNSQTGKITVFKKPFNLDNGFRIIPGFTKYCINRSGIIKEISSNEILRVSKSMLYPGVYLYNPEFNSIKKTAIHRLVALTWLRNSCFIERPIVNHKNGNKNDYRFRNLEWCSFSENSIHAVNNGLREDNKSFKVKDIKSGVVTSYGSFKQVCIAIGVGRNKKFKNLIYKRKAKILNGRYEVKYLTDNTPWLSDTSYIEKRGMYEVVVTYPNGEKETFHDTRHIMKKLKTWNVSSNIKNIIEKAKVLYPGIQFDVKQNYEIKPVQALNITTDKVIEASSMREMSRLLEISFGKVHDAVSLNHNRLVHGYLLRYKSELPWNKNFVTYVSAARKILAVKSETNEVLEFDSLRKAARYFDIDRSVISIRLKSGEEFDGWVFKDNN